MTADRSNLRHLKQIDRNWRKRIDRAVDATLLNAFTSTKNLWGSFLTAMLTTESSTNTSIVNKAELLRIRPHSIADFITSLSIEVLLPKEKIVEKMTRRTIILTCFRC